eukprot:GHVS01080766.1.p1 GENE.GHVS01080766.1~~GHVS01080766.1.p1  ORF type:complete len:419 (+),score=22.50 GHVS01080766.1:80-1336(+)
MPWLPKVMGISTECVHAGVNPEEISGAILTPIFQSTTFVQPSVEGYLEKGFSYSRCGNPTVSCLEDKIAELEGIKKGNVVESCHPSKQNPIAAELRKDGGGATCFGTGMAATYAVLANFLTTGDHCIMTDCSYGGTNRCARVHFSKYGIKFDFVDFRSIETIQSHIKENTKLIFSETPTNPILSFADIEAISKLARSRGILHVCDSTFATPVAVQPLMLGADLVIHSTTKFFDGHNMTTGGAVVARNKELHEAVQLQRNICGSIMSPQVAFYTLQTMKTLPLRLARQSSSALLIGKCLESHAKVASVSYPGLDSFPQRALALKQHRNDLQGGMLCFEVRGGTEAGVKMMNSIKRPWSLCENLGACESIITCPAVFTHSNMLKEDRLKVGITDGMIRVSVGLEDPEDLIAALVEALDSL